MIYPRIDVFMYCQPTTTFNWNNLQIRVLHWALRRAATKTGEYLGNLGTLGIHLGLQILGKLGEYRENLGTLGVPSLQTLKLRQINKYEQTHRYISDKFWVQLFPNQTLNFTCLSHHFSAEGTKNSKLCDFYLMIRKNNCWPNLCPAQTCFLFWWVISIPLMKESVSTITTLDKHIRIITFPWGWLPVNVPPPRNKGFIAGLIKGNQWWISS